MSGIGKPVYPNFFTEADLDAYRGQARDILRMLSNATPNWVRVTMLELGSGTTRAAARIHTLRNDWDIEMRRDPNGRRGEYRLVGRQNARVLRAHCKTCMCNPVRVPATTLGQQEMVFQSATDSEGA